MAELNGRSGFSRGVREALFVPICFAVLGLAAAELQAVEAQSDAATAGERVSGHRQGHGQGDGQGTYPAEMQSDTDTDLEADVVPKTPAPSLWLVDGFNVVSVALLREQGRSQASGRVGWWRRENRETLIERVRGFDDPSVEVWVVFDGADPGGNDESARPRTVFAPSADDWVLDRVRAADDPGRLAVVTADRRLANRARSRGALVVSPGDFLSRCIAV